MHTRPRLCPPQSHASLVCLCAACSCSSAVLVLLFRRRRVLFGKPGDAAVAAAQVRLDCMVVTGGGGGGGGGWVGGAATPLPQLWALYRILRAPVLTWTFCCTHTHAPSINQSIAEQVRIPVPRVRAHGVVVGGGGAGECRICLGAGLAFESWSCLPPWALTARVPARPLCGRAIAPFLCHPFRSTRTYPVAPLPSLACASPLPSFTCVWSQSCGVPIAPSVVYCVRTPTRSASFSSVRWWC